MTNHTRARMPVTAIVLAMWAVTFSAAPGLAQEPAAHESPAAHEASAAHESSEPPAGHETAAAHETAGAAVPGSGTGTDRIFGVLPNYATVERETAVSRVTTSESFHLAALSSFDPYVFPFVGFVAGLGHLQGQEPAWGRNAGGFSKRYGVALADNTIGNFFTTAIVSSAVRQDPRYFALQRGGILHRVAYAASRSVVTRSRGGRAEFNVSEIGGNGAAALLSNLYYPAGSRSLPATMGRWGSQVMWDTLSNELKEFWPDVRRKMRRR